MIEYIPLKKRKHFAVPCEKYSLLSTKEHPFREYWHYIDYVQEALHEQGLDFLINPFSKAVALEVKRCSPINIDKILTVCKTYLDYANKVANER